MGGVHAKKSPSGAKRWHGCAGALAVDEILPEELRNGSGAAAQRGTAAHFLLETSLGEQQHPEFYEGRIIVLDDDENASMLKPKAKVPKGPGVWFIVDDDMIANVAIAWEYVEARCRELGVTLDSVILETRTNPCPDRDDTSGTADVTIDAWPTMLEVFDYKNGRITVEHEDNPQLLAYLAGRAHDTGWLHDAYRITVGQPNGRHDEGRVRPFDVSKEKLLAFVEKHRAAAERADEAAEAFAEANFDLEAEGFAEKYLTPGDHCDWCPAAMICPSFKKYAREQARADFEDAPTVETAGLLVRAVEEATLIKKAEPFLRSLIRRADMLLTAEARAGRMPPAFKFVRASSVRQWKPGEDGEPLPPEDLARQIVADGFVEDESSLYAPRSLLSGPQVEKLIRGGRGNRRKEFSERFLHRPPGSLKLVPRDAPGEEVVVSAADDFAEFKEEDSEDEGY